MVLLAQRVVRLLFSDNSNMFEGLSKKISLAQLVNLSLATFLLVGIGATTYAVNNLTTFQSQAARGGGGSGGGGKGGHNPPPSAVTVTIISTNPVPVSTAPTFYETGFPAGASVSQCMLGFITCYAANADSTGSLTYTYPILLTAVGQYTFQASLINTTTLASVTFNVK